MVRDVLETRSMIALRRIVMQAEATGTTDKVPAQITSMIAEVETDAIEWLKAHRA